MHACTLFICKLHVQRANRTAEYGAFKQYNLYQITQINIAISNIRKLNNEVNK
jgi:hypothetical protein